MSKPAIPSRTKTRTIERQAKTRQMLRDALAHTGAEYAIYWRWHDERKLLVVDEYRAVDGALMQPDPKFVYEEGEGEVGIVWQSRQPLLLTDARKLHLRAFKRLQLGIYFGVDSVHFSRTQEGVLELGTTKRWGHAPVFDSQDEEHRKPKPTLDPRAHLPRCGPTRERLRAICDTTPDCIYAIFWQHFPQVGELKASCWFAQDDTSMRRSQTFSVSPDDDIGLTWDEGAVGDEAGAAAGADADAGAANADKAQPDAGAVRGARLLTNVHEMPLRTFKRATLAAHCGIRSIALRCYREGVLEMGSTDDWTELPADADPAFRLAEAVQDELGLLLGEQPGVMRRNSYLGTIPLEIALVFQQRKALTDKQSRGLWRRYANGGDTLGHAEILTLLEDMHETMDGHRNVTADELKTVLMRIDSDDSGVVEQEEFLNFFIGRNLGKVAQRWLSNGAGAIEAAATAAPAADKLAAIGLALAGMPTSDKPRRYGPGGSSAWNMILPVAIEEAADDDADSDSPHGATAALAPAVAPPLAAAPGVAGTAAATSAAAAPPPAAPQPGAGREVASPTRYNAPAVAPPPSVAGAAAISNVAAKTAAAQAAHAAAELAAAKAALAVDALRAKIASAAAAAAPATSEARLRGFDREAALPTLDE